MQRSVVVISLTLVLICMGCANKKASDKPPVRCCKPIFSIWFHPDSGNVFDDDVTLTETDTSIRISRGDHDQPIRYRAEYNALKDFILSSSEWRKNAKKDYFSGPWSGPPRDILIIDNKGVGHTYQGRSVPPEWKRRILSLSRKHKNSG